MLMLMLVIFNFCACENSDISIVEDESFYSDFYVEDNVVYINCTLTVNAQKDQTISFVADFKDEKKDGLLKEISLETLPFNIKKGKQSIDVTFVGNFGGNNKKANRELPNINIVKH